LGAQIIDGGDAFLGRLAQPVGYVILHAGTLLQAMFFDDLLYHDFILPHVSIEEMVFLPNAKSVSEDCESHRDSFVYDRQDYISS